MGRMMRGVVFVGDRRTEVREFPRPVAQGTQILVQIKASGLCGSDMHSYGDAVEIWREHPIIRGHEPGGVVVEVGDAVTMVRPGARVSVYHAPSCGHCEACSRGEFFNCTTIGPGYRLASMKVHGSDADYLLVDQNVCFPLPDELTYEDGAIIACAGGTAYHAVKRSGLKGGETILITGLGPVGLCALLVARAMGGIVIGADPVEYRRDLAARFGASAVLDPVAAALTEQLRHPVDMVIETSGNDDARVGVIDATTYHGRIVYVGWGGTARNATVGPMLGERCLMGSNMFTESDYYELIRLMQRTGLRFAELVTHRFPLSEAQEAFDLFATGRTGKVMFTWD